MPSDEQRGTSEQAVAVDERAIANARGAVGAVRTASETVDGQLATIDERANSQADEIASVVHEVSDLSATIEEVAASTDQVATRSEDAAERAADGRLAATEAMEVIEAVRETSEELATEVEQLNDRIDTIETALAGIDDIAEQTNLLALNASIEAARADGNSEGFAVVADEIKSLAGEAQSQADTIESALTGVQSAADETVAQLEATTAQIERGADHVADTMDEFDAVADVVSETADDVQSVSAATEDLADSSESIATSAEGVADRADDIGASIGEIRDARGEQTEMLREVEDALSTADVAERSRDRLSTGLPVDEHCGGLVEGGQHVLRSGEGVPVDDLLARLVVAALADGRAVSLTPTPTLDRETLADAFGAAPGDDSLSTATAEDRLFVLDAFDTWNRGPNVFDLQRRSLGEVNEETDARRDAPLLIVGNIAGEIAVLGEQAAREARYENDGGVFEPTDTVLNVVDDRDIDDTFAAFYVGAAEQVFRVTGDPGDRQLVVVESPGVAGEPSVRIDRRERPGAPSTR
jgi:uncharacterized protein YoxC